MATALSDRPIRIKVFKNGDLTLPSKAIVLNKKYFRTFDGLLDDCTNKLKLTTRARDICTPTRGTRVQTLETFQQDGSYVVVTNGPFRKLGYGEPIAATQHHPATAKTNEVKPVQHSRIQTSAKYKKIRNEVTKIFVYANGNALEPAHPLTLNERELKNWDNVLSKITERVNLTSGAVRKLYDLEGQMITDCGQLDRNQYYVAVGAENKLKKLSYGSQRPLFSNSPRREKQYKPHDPYLPPKRRRPRRPGDSVTTGTTDTSPTASTVPSNQTSSTLSRRSRPTNRPKKEEDGVFHARPVKYKRSSEKQRRQADYDKDEGGVFKAKGGNREVAGAQEVEETKETKVELPVDQMEAQQVQDEDIEIEDYNQRKRSPTPPRDSSPPREPTPPPRDRTMTPKPPSEPPQSRHSSRKSQPPSRISDKPPSRKSEKPVSRHSERPVEEEVPPSRQSDKVEDSEERPPQSRQSEKPASRQASRQSEKPASRQSEKPSSRQSEKPASRQASRQSEKPASRQSRKSNISGKEEQKEEEEEEIKEEEAAEDDDIKREEAATKIQAGYRGYKGRQEVAKMKEEKEEITNSEEKNEEEEPANQEEGNKSPEPEPANQEVEDKSDEVTEDEPTNQEQDDKVEPANENEEDNRPKSQNNKDEDESANQNEDEKKSEESNEDKENNANKANDEKTENEKNEEDDKKSENGDKTDTDEKK